MCSMTFLTPPFHSEWDEHHCFGGWCCSVAGWRRWCEPSGVLVSCEIQHQLNYSTIQKETPAMLLAYLHLHGYVHTISFGPVYTDCNFLVCLKWKAATNALFADKRFQHPTKRQKSGINSTMADALTPGRDVYLVLVFLYAVCLLEGFVLVGWLLLL